MTIEVITFGTAVFLFCVTRDVYVQKNGDDVWEERGLEGFYIWLGLACHERLERE